MSDDFIQTILFQLFVIILMAEIAKMICQKIKVPTVIGEIMVGVIIANTFIYGYINLDSDIEVFEVFKELGVIFLLFTVGLETPFSAIRKVGKTAFTVAVLGVILPFFAGLALILVYYGNEIEGMFVGAAMVATSVGITARVIKDMDLTHTIESRVIIGAAVIDDVLGMIVLAIVIGVSGGDGLDIVNVAVVSLEAVLFVLAVIFIGSIMLPKMMKKEEERRAANTCPPKRKSKGISPLPLALIICFALSSISSFVGLAAIIGAFLAGMAFAEFKDKWPCEQKIEPITEFLSPFFFIFVGMEVALSEFSSVLLLAIIITILAIITKFVGCGLGAMKLGGRSASIIGVGMIPRGEVGLIVAMYGLQAGVVESELYNAIVFMSLATTLMAPPLLTYTFNRKTKGKKGNVACEEA